MLKKTRRENTACKKCWTNENTVSTYTHQHQNRKTAVQILSRDQCFLGSLHSVASEKHRGKNKTEGLRGRRRKAGKEEATLECRAPRSFRASGWGKDFVMEEVAATTPSWIKKRQ
jgi:hypothetical protein